MQETGYSSRIYTIIFRKIFILASIINIEVAKIDTSFFAFFKAIASIISFFVITVALNLAPVYISFFIFFNNSSFYPNDKSIGHLAKKSLI